MTAALMWANPTPCGCEARRTRSLYLGALLLLVAGCAGSSPAIRPKASGAVCLAKGLRGSDLGPMAIATFDVLAKVPGRDSRRVADAMGATAMFEEELVGGGLTVLDRGAVDARLRELKHSASALVSDQTHVSFGNEFGAQTIVVGLYRFSAEGQFDRQGSGRERFSPQVVRSQSLEIRGISVETGQTLFTVRRHLPKSAAIDRLLPRSLARASARALLAALREGQTDGCK